MENSAKNPVIGGNVDKLTTKEERFCYEYCIDLNATKAAIRAGYSEKSARSIGSENLSKPHIKRRIEEKQNDLSKAAGITALRIIKELEKIAFSNMGDLRINWTTLTDWDSLNDDQKSCIQEVETTPGKYGDSLKVKFYNKQEALKALANLLGIKAPSRTEISSGEEGEGYAKTIYLELINKRDQVAPESKSSFGM